MDIDSLSPVILSTLTTAKSNLLSTNDSRDSEVSITSQDDFLSQTPYLCSDDSLPSESLSVVSSPRHTDNELQLIQHNESFLHNKQEAGYPFRLNGFRCSFDQISVPKNESKCNLLYRRLSSGRIRNTTASSNMTEKASTCNDESDNSPSCYSSFLSIESPTILSSSETERDGNHEPYALSGLSSDDDFSQKKRDSENKKKWICSHCNYYNSLKTEHCLNCGNSSLLKTTEDSYTLSTPSISSEIMNHLAFNSNQLDLNIEVGGGYTLRDFPYAYLPNIPSGDSSEVALKLLALRYRRYEPHICARCGSTNTPKWRRSPPPMRFLLCNACGLQYSKGMNDHNHFIAPLEECQGEYCVRARAEGKNLRRRLFNKHIF